jgi:hypothetical protein
VVIIVVITSKTQIKKRTESKTLGYLPRVLFFKAFELGAESANQVFSKEAIRSTAEVFSTIN